MEEGIKRSQIGEGEKGTSSGGQEKGVQALQKEGKAV